MFTESKRSYGHTQWPFAAVAGTVMDLAKDFVVSLEWVLREVLPLCENVQNSCNTDVDGFDSHNFFFS